MNKELDLGQILGILGRKLWLIILLAVFFGGAAYAISTYVLIPQYSATSSMYVYNERSREDAITSTDLTTSQRLVQTYIVVLTSNIVMDKVSDQLDSRYTADQIRNMLSASSISDTEAFQVTVTHPDPTVAQEIANTIAQVAPAEILRVVKAGSVEVIDYAKLPTKPSSPNIMRNTAIGVLLGLVLSIMIALLQAMFDTVVHSEEELTAEFNIPILGVIPKIDNSSGKGGRY